MIFNILNNGMNSEDYVIGTGKATRDVVIKHFGADDKYTMANLNLAVEDTAGFSDEDKKKAYLTLTAMFGNSKYLKNIRKGDYCFFVAKVEQKEYNGKDYTNYIVQYINKMTEGEEAPITMPANNFVPMPNDDGLPF